jgi:phenylalanyl-tRNA synthetase beta chain
MTNDTFTTKAKTILTALGFQIHENTITAPLRRGPEDMNIPEDITEEVARIRGYEHIENTPAKTEIKNQTFSDMVQTMRITEQVLVERCRATQVETYPWVSEKMITPFMKEENADAGGEGMLRLQNPVNPECPLLRDSFIYQFIQIATKNAKFFDTFTIFDTGKMRTADTPENNEAKEFAKAHINEHFSTGILLYKKSTTSRAEDTLLEAKGILQTLLNALGLYEEVKYEDYALHANHPLSYFHPKKQGYLLYKGKKI